MGSLGQAVQCSNAALKPAPKLRGWGPMTVDEDFGCVVWPWLAAAARWVSGSSSKEIIHFIVKIKLKYVQGLKDRSETCQ